MKLPYTDFQFDPRVQSNNEGPYYIVVAKDQQGRSCEVANFPFFGNTESSLAQGAKTLAERFAYLMNSQYGQVMVPVLDIDKLLYPDTSGRPHARGRLERTIVANLIAHLELKGFTLYNVYDGEEFEKVSTMKEAMELMFNLDVVVLNFKNNKGKKRWIQFVFGNGVDCISDYVSPDDESDGWSKAMDEFEPEKFE